MVNIWDYANKKPKICVNAKDGNKYAGRTLMVWDALETESEQDSIDIRLRNGEIKSFYPDEIESIEVLND